MKLILPPEVAKQLIDAMVQVGRREVGGILMGEYLGRETFCVTELTIQHKGGTFARFIRMVEEILAPLRAFFDATKHDYTRFNYLGEWHSHHSFALTPSKRDHRTMYDMVMDPQLGARFIVLLLVRLDNLGQLEANATVYQPNKAPFVCTIIREGAFNSVEKTSSLDLRA
jgi:hypothetical protein